jgi:hypothetical protein
MNIKTTSKSQFSLKKIKIGFETGTANFVFIGIIIFIIFNQLLALSGTENFSYITQAMIVLLIWSITLFIVAGPSEAFKFRDAHSCHRDEYERNIRDFKKSILVGILIIGGLIGLHYETKPIPPKPLSDLSIPVKSIQVYEIHKDKDSFAIRYIDGKGNILFNDVYNELKDRNAVLERIFDKDGKLKVTVVYKRVNGVESIEILNKITNVEG